MAEKMIQMSKVELKVITKLLGNMTRAQWRAIGKLDSYEDQVLWMTYQNLQEEFPHV